MERALTTAILTPAMNTPQLKIVSGIEPMSLTNLSCPHNDVNKVDFPVRPTYSKSLKSRSL